MIVPSQVPWPCRHAQGGRLKHPCIGNFVCIVSIAYRTVSPETGILLLHVCIFSPYPWAALGEQPGDTPYPDCLPRNRTDHPCYGRVRLGFRPATCRVRERTPYPRLFLQGLTAGLYIFEGFHNISDILIRNYPILKSRPLGEKPDVGEPRECLASPWSSVRLQSYPRSASVEPRRRQWLDAASLEDRQLFPGADDHGRHT
jgi:hypothetical protein